MSKAPRVQGGPSNPFAPLYDMPSPQSPQLPTPRCAQRRSLRVFSTMVIDHRLVLLLILSIDLHDLSDCIQWMACPV
jgi:hypothetical protein